MAKLVKKSKCTFEAGHIVKKDKVIGLPMNVWLQLNKLELIAQQYRYLVIQPAHCDGPSLEGFERKSMFGNDRPYAEMPDTPVMDQRVEEAMKFMAEIDGLNDTMEINQAIDSFGDLVDWCAGKKFIEGDCYKVIDTPEVGNPLTLEPQDIADFIKIVVSSPIVIEE